MRRARSLAAGALLASAWLLVTASGALASCASSPSIENSIRNRDRAAGFYDTIFLGTVIEIEPARKIDGAITTPVRFSVEAVLRGHARPTSVVFNPGGCSGEMICVAAGETVEFAASRRYVVVAHTLPHRGFSTNSCVPTKAVSTGEARRLSGLVASPQLYPASEAWSGAGRTEPSAGHGISGWVWVLIAATALTVGSAGGLWLRRRRT